MSVIPGRGGLGGARRGNERPVGAKARQITGISPPHGRPGRRGAGS